MSDKVFLRLIALFNSADLLMKLTEGTGPDGRVTEIGQIVIDWVCKHIGVSTLLAYLKPPNFSLPKFSNSNMSLTCQ